MNQTLKKLPVISELLLNIQINLDQYRSFKIPYIGGINFSITTVLKFCDFMIILQDGKHAFYKCLTKADEMLMKQRIIPDIKSAIQM